jgi:hypothetical protein
MPVAAPRRWFFCASVILACVLTALPAVAAEESTEDVRTVLFGSLDAGRSTFVNAGAKRALAGSLDQDGPVALATVGYGARFERPVAGGPLALRQTTLGSALIGYQWAFPWGVAAGFVGAEASYERLTARWGARDNGLAAGVRVQGELWAHPSEATLVTASLVLGSSRLDLWSRIALGYRIFDGVFVGPEVATYATDTYRKWQVGLHATGLQIGQFGLRLSGGYLREEQSDRDGPYFALAGHIRL